MLVPELKKATSITVEIFSWYIIGSGGDAYIDFGQPNTSVMSDSNAIVYLPIKS